MKRKGLVKKAVLPALVALVCSVIALTSVSYAWFTMGNQASVDEMELQVTTSDGLQMSASGDVGTYKSQITLTDLKSVKDESENLVYVFPTKVAPISTDGTVVDGNQQMYLGTVNNDGTLTSVKTTANYICFDLYIQTSTVYTLKLDLGSYVKTAATDSTTDSEEAHLAARVSFVNLGCASTAAGAQALDLTNADTAATIWEPNSLKRAAAVLNNAMADDSKKITYYGVKSEFEKQTIGTNAAVTGYTATPTNLITPEYNQSLATTAQGDIFQLGAGYNRIRVYIWLEGQDVDCVNEIAAGKLQIKLNFAVPTSN